MLRMGALRLVLALWLAAVWVSPAIAETWRPLEVWRIDQGRVAPWAASGTRIDPRFKGREVRFERTRLAAPHPLACEDATYEWIVVGPESLFEGNLPMPAGQAAGLLGLGEGPVATLRVGCANAGFDFHRTSRGDLLLGLDNVVWTLKAVRTAASPEEVVQELLVTHFTHDMGFTRESVTRKRTFLSSGLHAGIIRYLATPQSPDEAPEINGDPFTDSQEYPDRFTLGVIRTASRRTIVPVHFADSHSKRRVDYVLILERGRWVLDDLVDDRGGSLRAVLAAVVK